MKICIAGKNNIAVNSLEYLINNTAVKAEDILVIPNSSDWGADTWQRSLKKAAGENNIRVVGLEDIYVLNDLLFISLEFDKILKTARFKSHRLFNIHFSKLPAYKGMYTSAHPLLNGEKETGVTLHRIDDGIDTGEVIDQISFEIFLNDTCRDVYLKYIDYGFELFKRNIDSLISDNVKSVRQFNVNSTYYSKNSINYNNLVIDFNKTAFEIHNQLRAFIFEEYQLPVVKGNLIVKSILTERLSEKPCSFEDRGCFIEISGIDRYIVEAYKVRGHIR